ncbi:hypothetical protein AVEN_48978-1 [Araneus ventricosus]|uniref:Uncharacterized protein n=1 Tax=Araneus ventricosus TaxID=182803 RepID=A0A4Y2AJA8_ARAVE|nr:hypothetical protein AVEN_48978-1 [Araneus ventricosus]
MHQITVSSSLIRASCQSEKFRMKNLRVPLRSPLGNTSMCHFGHIGHIRTSGSSDLAWVFRSVLAFLWPDSKLSINLPASSVIRNVSSGQELRSVCSFDSTGVMPLASQNQLAKT